MEKELLEQAEKRMKKTLEAARNELARIRTGKATPALIESVVIECYGSQMPLNQLATITVPEPRLLVVQPWDKSTVGDIVKGIQKSELGLNPTSDGNVLRIPVPRLTEERRKDLVRLVGHKVEECRVAVRNIRRDARENLKKLKKNGDISEDDERRAEDELQKLTDKYVEEADELYERKEAEIMEV